MMYLINRYLDHLFIFILFIICLGITNSHSVAQIRMVETPEQLTAAKSGETVWLSLNKLDGEYSITYLNLEDNSEYESIILGDREIAIQFRDIIYDALLPDDFIEEGAEHNAAKDLSFTLNDVLIRVVREFSTAEYFKEQFDVESEDRVSVRLFVNYGEGYIDSTRRSYIGSTYNTTEGWKTILSYFDE